LFGDAGRQRNGSDTLGVDKHFSCRPVPCWPSASSGTGLCLLFTQHLPYCHFRPVTAVHISPAILSVPADPTNQILHLRAYTTFSSSSQSAYPTVSSSLSRGRPHSQLSLQSITGNSISRSASFSELIPAVSSSSQSAHPYSKVILQSAQPHT